MASLAAANLPSSDEEDDDYDPSKDPTGEKDDGIAHPGSAKSGQHGRGAGAADAGGVGSGAAAPEQLEALTPAQTARRERMGALFEQLSAAATGSANKLSRADISLASLCGNTAPGRKRNTDALWMRPMGITPNTKRPRSSDVNGATTPQGAGAQPLTTSAPATAPPAARLAAGTPSPLPAAAALQVPEQSGQEQQKPDGQQPQSGGALRAAAAAALAAAKEGALGGAAPSYGKVLLTETRRFAGQDIQVSRHVEADSREAQRAAGRGSGGGGGGGLDAFLAQIEAKKKVSVLDKTKLDWQDYKATDKGVQEELEQHRRSDKQYLERQEFLKRTELREYELERDKRLASDVRLRGRL